MVQKWTNDFIRIKSAPNSLFNEQYRSKCGMNLGGDKIGTYVVARWVVNGHGPVSVKFGIFFMKKRTFDRMQCDFFE